MKQTIKQWVIGIILLVGCAPVFAMPESSDDLNQLAPEDQQLLYKVIDQVDQGLCEAVMPDFDLLVKKYPDNYLVQYERAYCLYLLGRYDEIIKIKKKLLKNKSAGALSYQLVGNAYDMAGKRKDAIKVYEDGLKHFPQSGSLYLELGTVYNMDEDYNKALETYNRGILAEPNFASNYFRAASLYLASENAKVWGLVYAETAVILAPNNEARKKEMTESMIVCLKESIKLSFGDSTKLSVKLVPSRNIELNSGTEEVYLAFPGIYEAALGRPLMKLLLDKQPFTCSLRQLIEIRKGLVENYFDVTDNLYGNSMYLFEFQKKVIDAGHWKAYNYFLFNQSFPEEFEQWYDSDRSLFDSFIEWYNNEPFTLGGGRSVTPMQIFDHYHPLDLLQALRIQAELLTDK